MTADLSTHLSNLGFRHTGKNLDDIIAYATKKRFSPTQLLEHIAALEQQDRARRSLERRTARSRIGRFKSMADFDWSWPKKIPREPVEASLTLEFVKDARNVVLVAPQGLGKTMIAQNIAHQAILAGHSALFVTAAQLLLDLSAQESARGLERRLKHYASGSLLVIDEIGYLSYDNRNADLLFQIISLRYERRSTVLTTNLAFSDWPTIFPNATCTTALIDRVIHHADIIPIEGESYRLREAKNQKPTSKTAK